MKPSHFLAHFRNRDGETLATFGTARLVKYLSGKIELVGGSSADRLAAKEWCSLFMHEALIACSPPRFHSATTRTLQSTLARHPTPA